MVRTQDVIRMVRKHVGPVKVAMLVRDDVIYVQAVKQDLLRMLDGMPDGQVEAREMHGFMFVDRA
jgi:hypothetical protein